MRCTPPYPHPQPSFYSLSQGIIFWGSLQKGEGTSNAHDLDTDVLMRAEIVHPSTYLSLILLSSSALHTVIRGEEEKKNDEGITYS